MPDNLNKPDESRRCPRCGAELPPNVPLDACPRCLMQLGLSTQPSRTAAGTAVIPSSIGTVAELQAGQQFGHYTIVRLLGSGGMGAVYEAEDLDTGRRIALKVLGHALDSPQARQRFFREGRLAASINHPNSVYVFGTEEIGGTPVIAMELVAGGTLHERVAARGPLPFAEAVDSVLQVISGLEAAQHLGVLHRDVKPSNCFIDTYGTVKIGDFGLSLSTAIRADASITASGVYLGTPAFSSPEQLRGEELTVRSDIYAVGVTLYYLVTGGMPFEAPNIVQLLATVLERRPESPARLRPGIPNELGQVILKCLNKDPGERFTNYSELRNALVPFSSTVPTPAGLPLRFMAGLSDTVLIGTIGLLLSIVLLGGLFPFVQVGVPLSKIFFLFAGSMAAILAYYALLEGLWGATLGKAIFGLRLAGPDRNVPGIPKALLRALIFTLFPVLPYWIYLGFNPLETMARSSQFTQIGMSLTFYLMLGLLFSTARRRNGWAGLHDLLSHTRVIRKPKYQARPSPAELEQTATVPPAAPLVGPYHVLQTLEARDSEQWLAAYDTRLLRKVLLHIVPPGSPAVAAQLRNLARPGRFRWITGRRTPAENWDAYENPGGQPLLQLLDRPQPWSQVRFWISDLASELALAETDGTMPETLAINRVWITAQGFAKLMDFPSPGTPPTAEPSVPSLGARQPNNFLREIAVSALGGDTTPSGLADPKAPLIPLPLHARRFIDQLPQLNSAASVLSSVRPSLQKVSTVTRMRRIALVCACLAFPLLGAVGVALGMQMLIRIQQAHPDLSRLTQVLQLRSGLKMPWPKPKNVPTDRAFAIYISANFRQAITNQATWGSIYAVSTINGDSRRFAERSLVDFPNPSPEELQQATAELKPFLGAFQLSQPPPWIPLAAFAASLIIYVALPSIIASLLFRGGLLLLGFGIVLVTKTGQRASRLRAFWRTLLAWAPVFGAPILIGLLAPLLGIISAAGLVCFTVLLLTALSLKMPDRGLQDRLAGTYPVPR